jgi:hypothetical protein
MFQVVRAGLGQRQRSRPALEQRQAQFVFEDFDLMADRRSGHAQLIGGSLEATALGRDMKRFQKP